MSRTIESENRALHAIALATVIILLLLGLIGKQVIDSGAAEPEENLVEHSSMGSIDVPDNVEPESDEQQALPKDVTELSSMNLSEKEPVSKSEVTPTARDQPPKEPFRKDPPVKEDAGEKPDSSEKKDEKSAVDYPPETDDPKDDTPTEETTDPEPINADSLEPTEVEESVDPVEEMQDEDIEKKVGEYRSWVAEGAINVEFDYSKIPSEEMHEIAEAYYLTSKTRMMKSGRFGRSFVEITERQYETGLIIELSDFKSDWPTAVRSQAKNLGTLKKKDFIVQDRVALELYRCLGREARKQPLQGKTVEVIVQLKDGMIIANVGTVKAAKQKK